MPRGTRTGGGVDDGCRGREATSCLMTRLGSTRRRVCVRAGDVVRCGVDGETPLDPVSLACLFGGCSEEAVLLGGRGGPRGRGGAGWGPRPVSGSVLPPICLKRVLHRRCGQRRRGGLAAPGPPLLPRRRPTPAASLAPLVALRGVRKAAPWGVARLTGVQGGLWGSGVCCGSAREPACALDGGWRVMEAGCERGRCGGRRQAGADRFCVCGPGQGPTHAPHPPPRGKDRG